MPILTNEVIYNQNEEIISLMQVPQSIDLFVPLFDTFLTLDFESEVMRIVAIIDKRRGEVIQFETDLL